MLAVVARTSLGRAWRSARTDRSYGYLDRREHTGGRIRGAETPIVCGELAKLSWLTFASKNEMLRQARRRSTSRCNSSESRLPTAFMADAENFAGLLASRDDMLRALAGHGKRLLAEKVLAGGDNAQRLLLVQRMRRRQYDALRTSGSASASSRFCRQRELMQALPEIGQRPSGVRPGRRP